MSKFNHIVNSFLAGEFSPIIEGRSDFDQYRQAVELMQNYIPLRQGGAAKRPGTRHLIELGLGTPTNGGAALYPFIFSQNEAFVIAIKNNGVLPAPTQDWMEIYDSSGAAQALGIITSERIQPTVSGTPLSRNLFIPPTVDPRKYIMSQQGDFIIITHLSGTIPPMILFRNTPGSFLLITWNSGLGLGVEPYRSFPYRDPNVTGITITPSAIAGNVNLAASGPVFDAGHVGAYFKLNQGANTGVCVIYEVVDASNAKCLTFASAPFLDLSATDNWQESAWSTFRGFPRTNVMFEGRSIFGGNKAEPDKTWGSLSGNIQFLMERRLIQEPIDAAVPDSSKVFTATGREQLITDPFQFAPNSGQVNNIAWLSALNSLQVGTLGGEYIASGGDTILSNGSISFRQQTAYGGAPTKVAKVGDETLFLLADGKRLRNFKFSENNGSHVSVDLSTHATHMVDHGTEDAFDVIEPDTAQFKDMYFQRSRDSLWLLNDRNELLGFTYSIENKALAWHRHIIGGDDVNIWGVVAIPNAAGNHDDLFLSVSRTIDGGQKYYLEKIVNDFNADSLDNSSALEENIAVYSDSSKIINPVGAHTKLTGLLHLKGLTVEVVRNGELLGNFVVSAIGEVDLVTNRNDGEYIVGLNYIAEIETLDPETGGDFGSSQPAVQRIDRVVFRIYRTKDLKIGVRGESFEDIKFESGDVETRLVDDFKLQIGSGTIQKFVFRSDKPFPCTLLNYALRGVTYD